MLCLSNIFVTLLLLINHIRIKYLFFSCSINLSRYFFLPILSSVLFKVPQTSLLRDVIFFSREVNIPLHKDV